MLKIAREWCRQCRYFWRHQQGIAMMEFVVIAPFMVMFLYGLVEAMHYLSFQRRAQAALASLSRAFSEHQADATSPATPQTYTTKTAEWQGMMLMLRALVPEAFQGTQSFPGTATLDMMYVSHDSNNAPWLKWVMASDDFKAYQGLYCGKAMNTRTAIFPFEWISFPQNLNPNLNTVIMKLSLPYTPLVANLPFFHVSTSIDNYSFVVPRYVDTIALSSDRTSVNAAVAITTAFSCP
jgi:hypothetical protein